MYDNCFKILRSSIIIYMHHTYYKLIYFIIISEIGFDDKHNNVILLFNLIYSRSRYKLQSFIHGTMSVLYFDRKSRLFKMYTYLLKTDEHTNLYE